MASMLSCDGCGTTALDQSEATIGWIRVTLISRIYRMLVDNPTPTEYCPACADRMRAGLRMGQTQRLPGSYYRAPKDAQP